MTGLVSAMPNQVTSPPLRVTVLAALWVSLGRCGAPGSAGLRCDNGKLSLDRDLPVDGVYWDCAVSTWAESTQRRPSVDTVYNPQPARQICMDTPIYYNHIIPNSGAYRPVGAENGEYLYCPPQRWLNNLHLGATVLLYHPCAPIHERHLLSSLARSCLPDYIITPHPQLNKDMPIALVSWGRTLELSTVTSSDICDWLETTQTTRHEYDGVTQTWEYNLLLTWSAGLHRQEQSTKMKVPLRQCCKQTISSLLSGATEAELELSMKKERSKPIKERGKSRQIRAAIRKNQETVQNSSSSSTPGPSADSPPGKRTLSGPSVLRKAPQPRIQNQNQGLTPGPTAALGSNTSETTLSDTLGFGASQSESGRLMLQTAALQPSLQQTDLRKPRFSAGTDGVNSEQQSHNAVPEARPLTSKHEGTNSVKQADKHSDQHRMKVNDSKERNFDKDHTADGKMKDNEVVDVKQREVARKQIHSAAHSHHRSEKTGSDSVSKSESQPQQSPQPAMHSQPNSQDCDSCKAGEHCNCTKASGAEGRAAVENKGLQRTPRTDEAMWAAAALGFLLVLLTLSVLHTRLYRHWRTTPSLYWHDPRQDYDSVADVIRRRLRIAKRRRKRGRRQECVLLPSSSSSDEYP